MNATEPAELPIVRLKIERRSSHPWIFQKMVERPEGRIPPGSVVILSQYVTQRDPRWFPNPDAFDPERWTTEARAARPRFSYFPFSAGSRACLGEAFAGMEGVLALAILAQKWRLRLVPGHRIALQPQLTLRARHGIKMRIEPRS